MNSNFQGKPENALKRAEELEKLGTPRESLKVLHAALLNRKNRGTQQSSLDILEKIMVKYLTLCVGLRDGKMAKDGLYQYKGICQMYPNSSPLENVVKNFLGQAEEKAKEAQSKADKIVLDVEDLEAEESAESVMLSSISGENSKDRTDREMVTPWLKFLWETYRTILEIVRNNPKLETLYQETAQQAFAFCLLYKRNIEFRRLCLMLRNHLAILSDSSSSSSSNPTTASPSTSFALSSPEVHIETRFSQLNAAMELQLWQEAFRSIEDIHSLLKKYSALKKTPKASILPTYYQKLAQIYWISGNYSFHAYALLRHFLHLRQNHPQKPLSEEDSKRIATSVLLGALSIPVEEENSDYDFDMQSERRLRMASLLSFNNSPIQPRRDQLLAEASKLGRMVVPELSDLYEIFSTFNPLKFSAQMKPKLEFIQQSNDFKQYAQPFIKAIFHKQLLQLSSVYQTMKISQFNSLAFYVSTIQSERFILEAVKAKLVNVRIDHQKGVLNFGKGNSHSSASSLEATQTGISNLVVNLQTAVRMIHPKSVDNRQKKKEEYSKILSEMEQERAKLMERRELMEKQIVNRLQQEREEKRLEREKKQAAETAVRKEEEAKLQAANEQRAINKREREQKEEALRQLTIFCETLFNQTGVKADPQDLYNRNIDPEAFMKSQLEEHEKKLNATAKKYEMLEKKMNWFEKAKREKERPLLADYYNKHKHDDESYFKEQMLNYAKSHKTAYEKDLQEKKRVERFASECSKFESALHIAREKEFDRLSKIAEKEAAAKRAKQQEEKERREKEETEKRAEQERKKKLQEEEDAKKKEEEAAKRREREEKEAKLRETAEKQRKREEEALARSSASSSSRRDDYPSRRVDDYPPRRDSGRDEPPRRDSGRDEPPRRDFGRDEPPRRGDRWESGPRRDEPPRRDSGRDEPPRRDFGRDRDEPPRRDRDDYPPRRDSGRDEPPRRDFGRDEPPRRDSGREEPPRRDFGRDRDEPPRRGDRWESGPRRDEPPRRDFGRDRDEPPRRDREDYPPRRSDRDEPPRRGDRWESGPRRDDAPRRGEEPKKDNKEDDGADDGFTEVRRKK